MCRQRSCIVISQLKTGHPVRSAIHKQLNGRLVLRWVTTWESLLLLYVLFSIPSSFWGECIGYRNHGLWPGVDDSSSAPRIDRYDGM
jgi:hypothetical protein